VFERFTERARQAVVLVQQEARDLGHNYIAVAPGVGIAIGWAI
jgi:hypothetical protein